jgi:nitroimidazol reductase NimA-like FMN-containing flavoprotein (pyridoxamine 5'-phosphate oxidase superfamily)
MMARQRFTDEHSTDALTPISPTRCRELLRSQNIGRVAWQAADGLQILPVTYAVHDGTIIFRTSPYGVLSELIRPTDVALEIDELDQESRRGWSVVVQGRAQGVAEPAQLVRIWTVGGLVPWASGVRNVFIQIIPQRITGRDVPARSI